MRNVLPGWTFICTVRWAKASVCSSAEEIWSHKVCSCLCRQRPDLHAEQVWCWDRKPTRDSSFRKAPFVSRALRHQKGLFIIAIWYPLFGTGWGYYSWAYCPIISNRRCDGALGCTWLTAALRESTFSKNGNFLSRHFLGMLSAVALYVATFAFFSADAAFSLSSVLTADGGKVCAVQKFMRCGQWECCVLSWGTGCCCCSAMRRRGCRNVPFWTPPTAQLGAGCMLCQLNAGLCLAEQMHSCVVRTSGL